MTDNGLFPEPERRIPRPSEKDGLSADRRRTLRQAEMIAVGIHPLTRGGLHPLASRHRDSAAPKNDPFTCGSCIFREVLRYHNRSYPKCMNPGTQGADEYERNGPPRLTHGAASDVRAWWPACPSYSPGDTGLGPDAARFLPDARSAQ